MHISKCAYVYVHACIHTYNVSQNFNTRSLLSIIDEENLEVDSALKLAIQVVLFCFSLFIAWIRPLHKQTLLNTNVQVYNTYVQIMHDTQTYINILSRDQAQLSLVS